MSGEPMPGANAVRRRQRMADLRKAAQAKRFGSVTDIGGADFVREVTHAGPNVWVVLHLYKDGCAPRPRPNVALGNHAVLH